MAYKKLIKISNVCQLLDKSKYPDTQTNNGVTFTNNGDGSVTVNGTATADAYYNLMNIGPKALRSGLIAISLNALNGSMITAGYLREWVGYDPNNGYCFLTVNKGKTVNNVTVNPQLFDLTEMYGAGNEPTTVEQFRQDFPEEMYDYSPHCWLTSYKRVILTGDGNYLTSYQRNLTCKTKNLFDINSSPNLSINSNITINGNSIFCAATNKNASVSYMVPTVIGEKYTVSNKSIVRGGLVNTGRLGLFLSDNPDTDSSNYLVYGLQSGQSFTLTASSEFLYIHWYVCYAFYSNNPSTIEINELQVELGDTATDYVPYGHL